jgi:hypothetical protein
MFEKLASLTFAAFIIGCSIPCRATDVSRDDLNTALTATALAAHAADWNQTLQIARNPNSYYERNVVLGSHPSVSQVNAYFAVSAISLLVLSQYLSPQDRTVLLGAWTAIEVYAVGRNRVSLGLRLTF